jgi:hypothetical protein
MSDGNPRRLETLEVNDADDGLVVYDPEREMVHHLNASAALIFDLCDGTRAPASIAQVLSEAYRLDAPPLDQTIAGLRDLEERGLISWERSTR